MSTEKKLDDLEVATLTTAIVIIGGVTFYWLTQIQTTMELLELAYGSLRLFNNPLNF